MTHAIKAIFNPNIVPKHIYYGFSRNFCHSKELIKPLAAAPSTDILLQNLKSASSPQNVLKIVDEHYKIMNSKHVLQALRSIFSIQKTGTSNLSTRELLQLPEFSKLCRRLKFHSGVIELNEALESLKVISYVGVPSDSTIVQVLLQLIRQNINSLTLPNIMFLQFLLGNFKSSPLVDALKLALPIVFDIHLPIKIDRHDPTHLAEYLHFVSKTHEVSESTVKLIVESLCKCHEEFDAHTAKSIIWSLTDMRTREYVEPLVKKAINSLVIHVDDLNFSDIESTITKMIQSYSKKASFFYDEVFFDVCANMVVDQNLGIKNAVYILRKLARVNHHHKHLLDYTSKYVFENPSCTEQLDSADIYSIVVSVVLTEYRPIHWDNLRSVIQGTKNLTTKYRREIIWIRFAASLCLLDIFKIDVLTKALNPEYLENIVGKKISFMSDFENLFAIYQTLIKNRPELVDLIPTKFIPENIIENMRSVEFPLEAALHKGLGGENFVKSGLFSKLGARIDHTILFRKGGFPVPLSEDVKFIEDVEVLPDNQLVLVLALPDIHYTLNTKVLRGIISNTIRTLEEHGHTVVPVNLMSWEDLNDFEKIPYLMQAIKNKLENVDGNSISQSVM